MPPPPSRGRHPTVVFTQSSRFMQGKRIAGERTIVPDDLTKVAIERAGQRQIQGTFRVCIDDTGGVESVLPMRSTGFADYDRKLIGGIRTWRYSPYSIDGQPVPVCTAVTFVYSQSWSSGRMRRR